MAIACLLPAAAARAAPPPNDDFAAAEQLNGHSVNAIGTTVEATAEVGEPVHGGDGLGTSVWYRWRPERSGLIALRCVSSFQTRVAVYTGSTLSNLSEVVSFRGEKCGSPPVKFRSAAGVEHWIAVDAAAGAGPFGVELKSESTAPPNDSLAGALPFRDGGRLDTASGTTAGAGREPGEPFHGGFATGSSIWFRWTSEYSGEARIYPCEGSFHPVVAVYVGTGIGALTPVGSPGPTGDTDGHCTLGGLGGVALTAVAGQTYTVAVDGVAGAWGKVTVEALDGPLPPRSARARIAPRIRIRKGRANIRFTADLYGFNPFQDQPTFLCRLDRRPFRPCSSPKVYRDLSPGRHRFAVQAFGDPGSARTPVAVRHFRIRRSG